MFGIIMGGSRRRRGSKPALTHDRVRSLGKDTKMNWLLKTFYRLTGGRPMKLECSAFWDPIGQQSVFYFKDRLRNVRYMAAHKWAMFRVEAGNQN